MAAILTELSPAHLAEMVGNTRSRASSFMKQFRKLGFISYDVGDNLHIQSSRLDFVLHDDNFASVPANSMDLDGSYRQCSRSTFYTSGTT